MACDFSRLKDGRVLDLRPMDSGGNPLVFSSDKGWTDFEGTLGVVTDSKPLTDEEAADLKSREGGE